MIAGVSIDECINHFALYPISIKTNQFIDFLEELSSLNDGKKIAIFMDNMRVHRSMIAHEAYTGLEIVPIFNIPYSPQFNGIESVFSIMKEKYKRSMIDNIVHGEKFRPQELIIQATIAEIDAEKIGKCI